MTRLDTIVEKVVDSYRTVFIVTSVIAFVITLFQQNWIGLVVLGPLLALLYFVGLYVVGFVLSRLVHPTMLVEELRNKRVAEINRRLDAGELQAESEELEEEMRKAGLKPLSIITERGPVLGKQFDTEFYEWVEAKEGLKGFVERYNYVGQVEIDEDGMIVLENDDESKKHLVLNGVLYESIARIPEELPGTSVGNAGSVRRDAVLNGCKIDDVRRVHGSRDSRSTRSRS